MKTRVFNKFPQRYLKKKLTKKKVFLPTNPKKFGGVTGNATFFFFTPSQMPRGPVNLDSLRQKIKVDVLHLK